MVVIHGPSGCGKSSLVQDFLDWIETKRSHVRVHIGRGKYCQFTNSEPYGGIVAASNELCQQIAAEAAEAPATRSIGDSTRSIGDSHRSDATTNDHTSSIIHRFKSALLANTTTTNDNNVVLHEDDANQTMMTMLVNAVPSLGQILGLDNDPASSSSSSSSKDLAYVSLAQAFARFKQLWRSLLLAFSVTADVTILFLDDVHWADSNSLDLIHSLLLLGGSWQSRILVICAFRDDGTVERTKRERLQWCFFNTRGTTTSSERRRRRQQQQQQQQQQQEQQQQQLSSDQFLLCDPSSAAVAGMMTTVNMELRNFDLRTMNEMVSGVLFGSTDKMENHDTHELTEIIHRHTKGNPFFALHYLDYLSVEGLVYTNDNGVTWSWDGDLIQTQKGMPTSVGELLSKIVGRLPEKMQRLLITAAHIGHQFSPELLERESLFEPLHQEENPAPPPPPPSSSSRRRSSIASNALYRDQVKSILDRAVKEGLVVKCKGTRSQLYQFPHDQIQQSLYSMLSDRPNQQELLHYKIGWTMINYVAMTEESIHESLILEEAQLNDVGTLFSVVDCLNQGVSYVGSEEERIQLVQLNYTAAQLAIKKSAFEGAVQYARSAISLLPSDGWAKHYGVCLSLYVFAARLEHCTGNFVRSDLLTAEVYRHARTIVDQLPAFCIEIDVLGSRGDTEAALKLGIAVLRRLGEVIPKRPNRLHVVFEFFRASRLMQKTKGAGFLNLRPMKDPVKNAAMKVLSSVFLYSAMLGTDGDRFFAIVSSRMARMSCIHGLSAHTPYGITGFASLQGSLGDFGRAWDNASIALELLDCIEGAEEHAARTLVPVFGSLAPWAGRNLKEVHVEFLRSYHVGVSHGDINFAYYGIVNHIFSSFFIGEMHLDVLNEECVMYSNEMEEFQVNVPKWLLAAAWQTVRELLGPSISEPSSLHTGGVDEMMNEMWRQESNAVVATANASFQVWSKLVLGTMGQSDTLAEDQCLLNLVSVHQQRVQPRHFLNVYTTLCFGLGCLELLRVTKKRWRYFRQARQALRLLGRWDKQGVTMASAPHALLAAEMLLCSSSSSTNAKTAETLETAFLKAAKLSGDKGRSLLLEARSYERLSGIAKGMDDAKSSQYREKCLQLYTQWGAHTKLEQLRFQELPTFLDEDQTKP